MKGRVSMVVRSYCTSDIPALTAIWNRAAKAGETVYRPLDEVALSAKLFSQSENGTRCFVAEKGGKVIGFVHGVAQNRFLPGETHENTPGFLTAALVPPDYRRLGVGTALLTALEQSFAAEGKRRISVSERNPVQLAWVVPGTPGHEHNKAPGVDEDCEGYKFLLAKGYQITDREVAMYMPLDQYMPDTRLEDRRSALRAMGIETGRYDVTLRYDFDRMCDRVGSEYWRSVLQEETVASSPRPILAATHGGHIVGFTGPVDLESSGRGWFSGICTDPEYEKRGIATVLFNLLMKEFIAEGAIYSTLFTGSENRAQNLYVRTGFRIVRRFSVMTKAITP